MPMNYLVNYLADPQNRDAEVEFMTNGLSEVKEMVQKISYDKFIELLNRFAHNEAIVHALLHAFMLKSLSQIHTVQGCRTFLRRFNKEMLQYAAANNLMNHNPSFSNFSRYIGTILQYIIDRGLDPKGAVETSVITGCSIIAPYVGVLRKPFVGEREVDPDDPDADVTYIPTEESAIDAMGIQTQAYDAIRRMFLNSAMIDTILTNAKWLTTNALQDETIGSLIAFMQEMDRISASVVGTYACWVYLYRNGNEMLKKPDSKKVLDGIRVLADANQSMQASFEDIYQAFMYDMPANESTLEDELMRYETISKYMKYPESYESGDNTTDPLSLFNFVPLMNYIFTHRRFRTNDYVRTRYMKMRRVAGYVFYKNFLIIIPQKADGRNVDFVYVPVIDDLDGSTVKIIKYWRNATIMVLTESEYEHEIGAPAE